MDPLLIVDRIVEGIAVCQDEERRTHQIPVARLPCGIREGDCLRRAPDGAWRIDGEETHRRRQANKALFDRLLQSE